MPLKEAEKQQMVRATHEIALDMADDLEHIRKIITQPSPTSGDIRRISNQMRRILIDNGGDIRKVYPPRMSVSLQIVAPDVSPLVRSNKIRPFDFLTTAGINNNGCSFGAFYVSQGNDTIDLKDYDSERTVKLKLDGFLSQPVVCFKGVWVSRKELIKYVANVAGGVHSGDPKEAPYVLLDKIRYIANIEDLDGKKNVSLNIGPLLSPQERAATNRSGIDLVLYLIISAAYCLTISEDVIALEEIIRQEANP